MDRDFYFAGKCVPAKRRDLRFVPLNTPQMLRQKLQIFRRDEGPGLTQSDVARDRTEKGGI